jgi:hypothetical protein
VSGSNGSQTRTHIDGSGSHYFVRKASPRQPDTSTWLGASLGTPFTMTTEVPTAPNTAPPVVIGSTTFTAKWIVGAGGAVTGYLLDVSTDPAFGSFVGAYNSLSVGTVTRYRVTDLTPGTTYYYRVRSTNATGTSPSSVARTVTTDAATNPYVDTVTPAAWWKADFFTASDGSAVEWWPDAADNVTLGQATIARRPLYRTGVQNGKPALQFDGSNDSMLLSALTVGAFTLFMAFKATNTGVLFEHSTNAASFPGMNMNPSNSVDTGDTVLVTRSGLVKASRNAAQSWGVGGVFRVMALSYNGTLASLLIDLDGVGSALTAGANSGDPGLTTVTDLFRVAAFGDDSGSYLAGHIAELIIYDSALTSGQRAAIEVGLAAKYALTAPPQPPLVPHQQSNPTFIRL